MKPAITGFEQVELLVNGLARIIEEHGLKPVFEISENKIGVIDGTVPVDFLKWYVLERIGRCEDFCVGARDGRDDFIFTSYAFIESSNEKPVYYDELLNLGLELGLHNCY